MKKKLLSVFSLLLVITGSNFELYGQYDDWCNMKVEEGDSIFSPLLEGISAACAQSINYSVYPYSDHTPIKKVRICMHIFLDNQGTRNFSERPQHTTFLHNIIDSVNYLYSHLDQVNPGTSPHVPDAKVRFILNDIFHYNSDSLWNFDVIDSDSTKWKDDTLAKRIYQHFILPNPSLDSIQKYHTLHLLMGEGDSAISNVGGFTSNIGGKEYVFLRYYYKRYTEGGNYMTVLSEHLAHELGHSVGLAHNFDGSSNPKLGLQCSQCDDNDCPLYGTSNNFMDYHNDGNRSALSECQIALIHYYLMGKNFYRNIYDCLIEDYCLQNDDYDIDINFGENIYWEGSKYLRGNVTIKNGGYLDINCETSIPIGGKITVESGGELIISQGYFYNACNQDELWGTIEVQNGGYLEIDATAIRDYGIIVKSGGTLRIKDELLVQEKGYINIESNAYLCIDTDADIELSNNNNVIGLFVGYHAGVHTYYVPDPGTCSANPASITIDGSGCICSCVSDQQIQNETISSNKYICGDDIDIGYNVDSGSTYGNVEINNNATVIINARGEVYIKNSFTADEGCELIIQ